ncbi:MAG: VWA domain-containing protein [Deltaproteobacteria bacterium]|nr:VWA domain-containing protein [Deltaproteobacteria bacterium]
MRMTKRAIDIVGLGILITALVIPGLALAGSSDIGLFAGGGAVPPNIALLIDNSGSMDRDVNGVSPCILPCESRRYIATNAIQTFVDQINPIVAGVRQENVRLGLNTYRSNGSTVEVPLGFGTSDSVKTAVAALSSLGVGTPIAGSILDVGRYYAGSQQWGTLPTWGSLAGESVLADPVDLACRENFIIFLTDGLATSDSMVRTGYYDTIGDSDGDLGAGEGDPENNPATVTSTAIQWGDDITYGMFNHDFRNDLNGVQNVTTHMIGFTVDDPILERMADNGGGSYSTASDAAELAAALSSAVGDVYDSMAGFSTAVVPTSRTLSASTFYNAFFEPSGDAFWEGHLESYGLSSTGEILDAAGANAVDSSTGLLIEPHNPFWDAAIELRGNTIRTLYTTLSAARVDFNTANASITEAVLDITAADIAAFPNNPASGVSTTAQARDAVINYVHGKDAFDESGDSSTIDMRSKVMGDIFHSTPRIVAGPTKSYFGEPGYGCDLADISATCFYKSYLDRDRMIYSGTNDGLLHGFNAGDYSLGDDPVTATVEGASNIYYSVGDGSERFGYVPGLLLDTVKMISRNSPRTFYYVDGSPIHTEAWLGDGTGTDITKSEEEWATVMITGFREGGEGYIALDVTDPDAGALDDHGPYPLLLWEFTHAELAQAWSEAVITRVRVKGGLGLGDKCGYDDGDGDCREQWVAIVAGGYHPNGDPHTADFTTDTMSADWTIRGKAIFVIALDTGAVLARINHASHSSMVYSMPSSPAVLDLDSDGFADLIYVGDLGGQMWKWDISAVGEDTDADLEVDNWTAGIFFDAPRADIGGGLWRYQSFFFPPSATFDNGELTLAFGAGEREDLPYQGDSSYDENNRLFVVKDFNPTGPYAFVDEFAVARPVLTESDLTDVTSIKKDNNLSDRGFFLKAEDGEKFTSDHVIFAGFLITTSYNPNTSDLCSVATGESFLYALRISNAQGLYDTTTATVQESRRMSIGPGLASSPRISLAPDSANDKVFVKTSKSRILPAIPPERESGGVSNIYWKQRY